MSDEQHGLLGLPDAKQQLLHQLARLMVERAERLIHQQHARLLARRGRGSALLHAARAARGSGSQSRAARLCTKGIGDFQLLAARQAALAQPKQTLSRTVSQGTGCSSGTPCLSQPRAVDALAIKQNLARGLLVEAGDDAQSVLLPQPEGAEDGDEIVLGNVEIGRL